MKCALFAKMDQVFSLENRTLKQYWKNGKKYWENQGKVREFCQSRKVGTMYITKLKWHPRLQIWFIFANQYLRWLFGMNGFQSFLSSKKIVTAIATETFIIVIIPHVS